MGCVKILNKQYMNEKFSVIVEGCDQVGKGDAVENLSKELAFEGYPICVVSFPCYATPIGNAIRESLKSDIFAHSGLDPYEQVSSKMSLFALNRLEILNYIFQDPKDHIYVCDRGPFSNALTIAYGIAQGGISEKEKDTLIDYAFSLDSFFRKHMNADNCVINLTDTSATWSNSRSDIDLYENRDVQEISENIYAKFSTRVGAGWVDIVSKNSNGWRNREDILADSVEFVRRRMKKAPVSPSKASDYLPMSKVISSLYRGSSLSAKPIALFSEALRMNDKGGIYLYCGTIADEIVNTSKYIEWYNMDMRNAVKEIVEGNVGILIVLENLYGQDFVLKLLRSVYE